MKNLIIVFLLLSSINAWLQKPVLDMNECEFFNFLKIINTDEKELGKITVNYTERRDLIQKLENYILVFNDFSIAPVLLDPCTSNKYSTIINECDSLQYIYKKERINLDEHTARLATQKAMTINVFELLIKLLELDKSNNSEVSKYVSAIKHPYCLELIYIQLLKEYFIPSDRLNPYNSVPLIVREDNIKILKERLSSLDNSLYVYYQSYHSKPKKIKAFEMYHDNDVFLFSKINQDREYTGGFKFSIITDYFKWRWFRLGKKKEVNILTYQTISIGGYGYTPYIRYRNNFELADSLHTLDRPFASSMFLERSKNRIWRNGVIRHTGEFQVGAIGISQGRSIQAKLHEDVIHKSQFVYGWDKQIGDGGRLAIQANHKLDLMLYSSNNHYATFFRPNTIRVQNRNKDKYFSHNFIFQVDARVGTLMSAFGFGFRYSTLNFLQQSANSMISSCKPSKKDDFGIKMDIGFSYRYVAHNAMLEGLGFFKPFPFDEYDIVKPDNHVLRRDEVERNLFIVDLGINLKFRKTTVFYRMNFHTLEYKSRLANANLSDPAFVALINNSDADEQQNNIDYYNTIATREQNDFINRKVFGRTIYGYGTIGICWIIE